MEILTIDGTALPAPGAYKVQLSDLDSSGTGRTEDGVLVREMRAAVGWPRSVRQLGGLTTAQCAAVLNATAPDSMQVQYFSVKCARPDVRGDRTADLKAARDGRGGLGGLGPSDRILRGGIRCIRYRKPTRPSYTGTHPH